MAERGRRTCTTSRKRRYRDELAAKIALSDIARRRRTRRHREEVRAYLCPDCGGYHLTANE
jgi:hypothetical protein